MGARAGGARGVASRTGGAAGPALAWLSLALLAMLPYAGSLGNPLIHDDRTILDNPWLRDEAGVVSVFSHDLWFGTRHAGSDLYRPLTVLSLASNLRIAHGRGAFHAVNLLLHAGTVLLAAAALRAVLGILGRPSATASPRAPGGLPFPAWAGAALFAAHPLGSEAVLLTVGRAETLAAGLGLAAFLLLVRAEERDGWGGWPMAASSACFFLALLSKESASAWLVLGAAWWASRRLAGTPPRGSTLARGATFAGILALFLLLRGGAVGFAPHVPPLVDNPLASVDAATRVANASLLLGRYALKMLLPLRLTTEYGFDETRVVPLLPWGAVVALGLAVAWIAALVVLRRKVSLAAAFLWAWIPAAFAATANVLFPIGTIFGERLAYLPLIGACGLLGVGFAAVPGPACRRGFAIAVVLALASARTAARTRDFGSLVSFHEATARASPRSAKALLNLGRTRLEVQHRPADAAEVLERAALLLPDDPRTLRLLSKAYDATNRPESAARTRLRAEAAESRSPAPGAEPPQGDP
jgi:protein O-mannosyl-transferase